MTRLEFTLRELGHLYEFYRAIRPYRISPETAQAWEEKRKGLSAAAVKLEGEAVLTGHEAASAAFEQSRV